MAYVPQHRADVFVSYCHDDEFAWIERFVEELRAALRRKLRARTPTEIFFDRHTLRAGREFDSIIPESLEATGFFVALVSQAYNRSTYCRQVELGKFLRHHDVADGRVLQALLDPQARLPLEKALAIAFGDATGTFPPETLQFKDALRRIYEPIVIELDRLYAASKLIFLAWPSERALEAERERLVQELESRGMRIYPEVVSHYESDIRLRDAFAECTASVHLFGNEPDEFDLRQWRMANEAHRPCVVGSLSPAESRRGPGDSPDPIYLGLGHPTARIASALERLVGIGKREERRAQDALGLNPVYLLFKGDADATLGMRVRKRIKSQGPFEVIVPPSDPEMRYQELPRVKAAVLCGARAEPEWWEREVDALNAAMVAKEVLNLPRALWLPNIRDVSRLGVLDEDEVVRSEEDLDAFLKRRVQGAAA